MKNSLRALTLSALLLVSAAAPAVAESFSDAQKQEMHGIIKDYLITNPEVLVEAFTAYQTKQQNAEAEKFKGTFAGKKAEIMDAGAPIAGNPNGDITIIEFFDYNCGYCKKAIEDVTKLIENDKGIKFVFKEMPILSESSKEAARWALAAGKQGKYFEYHVALMKFPGGKDTATLENIGRDLGLDTAKLKKDAETDKGIRDMIEKSMSFAQELGIRGTPAFIIGDTLLPGYMGYEAMVKAVADARAAAKDGKAGE